MVDIHHARQWGIKASQAGLCMADNPYRNVAMRSAWEEGYRQISLAPAEQLDRAYPYQSSQPNIRKYRADEDNHRQSFVLRTEPEIAEILRLLRELTGRIAATAQHSQAGR